MAEGEKILQPWRDIGDRLADAVGPHSYAGWQQAFDGPAPAGNRHYWKSHNFLEMTDGMIETFVEFGETTMTPHATGGVYANFVPEKDGDQQAACRENYGRMVEVKTKGDPENVFQLNHNAKPTV